MQDFRTDIDRLINLLTRADWRHLTETDVRRIAAAQAILIRNRHNAGFYGQTNRAPALETLFAPETN
jgi:hypothetical protein